MRDASPILQYTNRQQTANASIIQYELLFNNNSYHSKQHETMTLCYSTGERLLLILLSAVCFLCCFRASSATDVEDSSLDALAPQLQLQLQLQHSTVYDTKQEDGGGGGLIWKDLSVVSATNVTLLNPCSGMVANGHICGVLGPSGAGKSTLVTALAGSTRLTTRGQVWRFLRSPQHDHDDHDDRNTTKNRNKYKYTSTSTSPVVVVVSTVLAEQVAWLEQHDNFFEMLTVLETLTLAAFLELPQLSKKERHALVQHKLEALGLANASHRRIGSSLVLFGDNNNNNGRLSGGERRRLSVALELLTDKQLFVADEPTTGLDATMSARVMSLIRDTCQELQIPALCVLHQPRSSVWHTLDAVIFMASGGRVCFAGERAHAIRYFAALGYPCPANTNPAEYFVDLISIDPEDPVQSAVDETRVQHLVEAFQRYQQKQLDDNREDRPTETTVVIATTSPSPSSSSSSSNSDTSSSKKIRRRRGVPFARLGALVAEVTSVLVLPGFRPETLSSGKMLSTVRVVLTLKKVNY
jgi:ABC-type multidrug transport system ATPase subunit